jgi:hypothetical protein
VRNPFGLSVEQRRYVFARSSLGGAVINALLNGAIGWGITFGLATFPIWKLPGVAGDLVATAFGVTFGTCLGAKLTVRWDIARGKVAALAPPSLAPPGGSGTGPWLRRLPEGVLRRSLWLGLLSIPVFALPVLLALWLTGEPDMERLTFVALKAAFSAAEAAVVTPLIVLAVLLDMSERAELG